METLHKLSTLSVHFLQTLYNLPVPFIYCLVFGALISPTDAIAIAALLKKSKMPEHLKTIITANPFVMEAMRVLSSMTGS